MATSDATKKPLWLSIEESFLELNVQNLSGGNKEAAIQKIAGELEDGELKDACSELVEALDAWDKDMVQRMSKAYDDVENFENRFSADYLFMINTTESSIPRVNDPAKDERTKLDALWAEFRATGESLLNTDIPALNEQLWNAGYGAVRIR